MSPSALADLFEQNPTTPFRITMASGDEIIVPEPRLTMITEIQLIIGIRTTPNERVPQRTRFVSIPNINLVEMLDRLPSARGGRRRPR